MARRICQRGLHWFPIATCIMMPATFFISYAVAVSLGHVEAGFPYISDTGTYAPESCIFGQLLNISSVLAGICIYIRYRQVVEHVSTGGGEPRLRGLNIASLVIGMGGAFGLSIVANFQESNVLAVHMTGAVLAFGLSAVYSFLNVALSFKLYPLLNSKRMCYLRLCISLWIVCCFCITFTAGTFAKKAFKGSNPKKWFPENGGFTEHIISTAAEWAMSAGILAVFATLVEDFRSVSMEAPVVFLLMDPNMDADGQVLA